MADEFYREEIIFSVNDEEAIRRTRRAEERISKTFDKIQKRALVVSKTKVSPVIEARDRATSQMSRVGQVMQKLNGSKASPLVSIRDRITKEVTRVNSLLRKLAGISADPEVRLRDKVTSAIKQMHLMLNRTASKSWEIIMTAKNRTFAVFQGIRSQLTSLQGMATIVLTFVGLNKLSDATVGSAMRLEQQQMSMEHWLDGNTKKAAELTKWLQGFADATPFDMDDLFPSMTRAVGVNDGDINAAKKMLTIATDMTALTPGKTVQEAMEALADAQMGEFERMKEFQVKMTKEQYKAIGGWEGFLKLVQNRVEGGAEKLSRTAIGYLSTISDKFKGFFRETGVGILESLKPRLQSIAEWFDDNKGTIDRWNKSLREIGKDAAESILSGMERVASKVNSLFENQDFQNADFMGKLSIAWDQLIAQPFEEWYNGSGKERMASVAESMGKGLGSALGAALMALAGVKANNEDQSPFVSAGATAAESFINGFSENFDLNAIVIRAGQSLLNINKSAFESPGNFIGALIADAIVISLIARLGTMLGGGLLLKVIKKIKIPKRPKVPDTTVPKDSTKKGPTKKDPIKKAPIQPPTLSVPAAEVVGKGTSKSKYKGPGPVIDADFVDVVEGTGKGGFFKKTGDMLKKVLGKGLLKRIPYIGPLLGATEIATSKGAKGKGQATGSVIGGVAGGALGTLLGPAGTIAGGVLGSLAGGWLGEKSVELFKDVDFSSFTEGAKNTVENVKDWFSQLPEDVGSYLAELPEKAAYHFGEIIGSAESFIGSLPDRFAEWFEETKERATTIFVDFPTKIGETLSQVPVEAGIYLATLGVKFSEWFNGAKDEAIAAVIGLPDTIGGFISSIPEKVSSEIEKVKQTFALLGAAIPKAIASGFNAAKEEISGAAKWAVEKAASGVGAIYKYGVKLGNSFSNGRNSAKEYANGGFINKPHLGLVGEAGPEVIIPLSTKRRNRAMDLYERAGNALGIRPYADGGFVGYSVPDYDVPEPPPPNDTGGGSGGGVSLHFDMEGMINEVNISKDDLHEKADEVGDMVARKLIAILENYV